MLRVCRARHPGPVTSDDLLDHLSVGFVNVGGWPTNRDMALDSGAQFLAEHRSIPAKARSIGHRFRNAGL